GGLAQKVSKSRLAEGGDYNLSAERYRANGVVRSKWPMVRLGEICHIERGTSITKDQTTVGKIPVIAGGQKPAYYHNIANREGCVITVSSSGAYAGFVNYYKEPIFASDCTTVRPKEESKAITYFVYLILKHNQGIINNLRSGMAQPHVYAKDLSKLSIPLPPLEIQRDIVEEIEGYQKVIDGARQVVENYKPVIPIDPSWPLVRLREICGVNLHTIDPRKAFGDSEFIYVDISSVENGTGKVNFENKIVGREAPSRARRLAKNGDVLLSTVRPNLKAFAYLNQIPERTVFSTGFAVITPTKEIIGKFLYYLALNDYLQEQMIARMGRGSYPSINQKDVKDLIVPLPPIEKQRAIVNELNNLESILDSLNEIINLLEAKIKESIERVWE
ncbi:MAG: restriction endonuclease subunit S, partial [Methanobacterium sp.]